MNLAEADLRVCAYALGDQIRHRQRIGAAVPEQFRTAQRRIAELIEAAMSADGPPTETVATHSVPIGTDEAAVLLGLTTRQVRRLAADLDGQQIGRAWVFDRQAVTDYANERRNQP